MTGTKSNILLACFRLIREKRHTDRLYNGVDAGVGWKMPLGVCLPENWC